MRSDAAIHVGRLVGDEVGRDEAGSPGRGEVVGEAVDAVLHDGVPVGHDQHRGIRALGDAAHRLEAVGEAEAVRERLLRGGLDDGAVHDGVGVRQPELEHVDAVLDERDRGLDALVERGEADRQVADERAAGLVVAAPDGGADRAPIAHVAVLLVVQLEVLRGGVHVLVAAAGQVHEDRRVGSELPAELERAREGVRGLDGGDDALGAA